MPSDTVRTSSRYGGRRLASLLFALVALAGPACGNNASNVAAGLTAAEACRQNSDCIAGLICALGACRAECFTSADCGTGGSCVAAETDSGALAICEYPNESCNTQSDCTPPLACASDYRCHDLCMTAADCNQLGISGQVCATDANGRQYCAAPSQVNSSGMLDDPAPPDANTSVPVPEPIIDATVAEAAGNDAGDATVEASSGSSGGSGSGSSSGSGSVDAAVDATVFASDGGSDAASDGGADAMADVTTDAPLVCTPACSGSTACAPSESGPMCVACGNAAGAPCCSGQCAGSLTCDSDGTCECGGPNQACCEGTSCSGTLTCSANDGGLPSCACGAVGQRCCPAEDAGAAYCSTETVCAGTRCSCVAQYQTAASNVAGYGNGCSGGIVLRTDGTVWASLSGSFAEISSASGPLRASAVTLSSFCSAGASQPVIGCALVSGNVWCFPLAGSLTDSTFLGAGLGPTDTTSNAVEVLTAAAGGTPLANVTQVSGGAIGYDGEVSQAVFCATTSDGGAWCWGVGSNGQLGNGSTANENYATQVMASASQTLAGVSEIQVGWEATCARKFDGTVWCWGTNQYGELGIPSSSLTTSNYSIQIAFTGTSAQTTAIKLETNLSATPCAIMQDTSVACWGDNAFLQAGAPADAGVGGEVGPTAILSGAGQSPMTGFIDLTGVSPDYTTGAVCARNGDDQILCWGGAPGSDGAYPGQYTNAADTVVSNINGALSGNEFGLGYVDGNGQLNFNGSVIGEQPPCSNLLP
jgi:hypothetical protein